MGNTTNKTYGQVSTCDDTKGDDSNLTFVFHTTEEDCTDRVVHDNNELSGVGGAGGSAAVQYSFTVKSEKDHIAYRDDFEERVQLEDVRELIAAGDVVEFVSKADNRSQWIVYVGDDACVQLRGGEILRSPIAEAAAGCWVKIVNFVYTYRVLPVVQVLHNATSQVGKPTASWADNSECFAMWCRTGRVEFMAAQSLIRNLDLSPSKQLSQNFTLILKSDGGDDDEEVTQSFTSLPALIEHRQKIEVAFMEKSNAEES